MLATEKPFAAEAVNGIRDILEQAGHELVLLEKYKEKEELLAAGVLPADYDFEAHKELVPMQPGDVPVTYADTSALERDFGFKPSTSLRDGLRAFARWYKEYYG